MSTQSPSEPEEDLAEKLQDLEAHISQRISRLGDTIDDEPLPPLGDYVPPFEPLEDYEYEARTPRPGNFSGMYRPVPDYSEGLGEVMRAVHDLSDLVTESVLNVNVRLATLEEKLALIQQSNAHDVRKGVQEIKKVLGGKGKVSEDQSECGELGSTSELVRELQLQVKLLEEYINRSSAEVRQRMDERTSGLREHLDIRAKVLEKMSSDNKHYLNRHFFSLAILFIIIIFISSALMTNSIDRLSGYMAEHTDSIRAQIDQLVFPGSSK